MEDTKIKQERRSGKFLRSFFPSQLLSCGMKHLQIMSHAIQALPSAPLLTDLGNNQTCPLPEQETSPKLVSILTPSKQKLMGDKRAHTDTAQTGLSAGPLTVSVLFICSLLTRF